MYCLDTNTIIYYFRGQGRVSQNLLAVSPQEVVVPTIVFFELQYGIMKASEPNKRIKQLKQLTEVINFVSLGEQEAKSAAIIRRDLENTGITIGPYDLLIAGTALANNFTLVTHNSKEFKRINTLKVVDWF